MSFAEDVAGPGVIRDPSKCRRWCNYGMLPVMQCSRKKGHEGRCEPGIYGEATDRRLATAARQAAKAARQEKLRSAIRRLFGLAAFNPKDPTP